MVNIVRALALAPALAAALVFSAVPASASGLPYSSAWCYQRQRHRRLRNRFHRTAQWYRPVRHYLPHLDRLHQSSRRGCDAVWAQRSRHHVVHCVAYGSQRWRQVRSPVL